MPLCAGAHPLAMAGAAGLGFKPGGFALGCTTLAARNVAYGPYSPAIMAAIVVCSALVLLLLKNHDLKFLKA